MGTGLLSELEGFGLVALGITYNAGQVRTSDIVENIVLVEVLSVQVCPRIKSSEPRLINWAEISANELSIPDLFFKRFSKVQWRR